MISSDNRIHGDMIVLDVKLDKLTIVGNAKHDQYGCPLHEFIENPVLPYGSLLQLRPSMNPNYSKEGKLGEHAFIQVQYRNVPRSDFRVEFNPSKVTKAEADAIDHMLSAVKYKRLTRVDLAMDINVDLGSGWEIIDERNRKEEEHRHRGRLETRYVGSRHGDNFVRIYDKAKESGEKGTIRWRIEEVLKDDKKLGNIKTHEWFKGIVIARKEVERMMSPRDLEGMKPNDKALVIACLQYPELIEEFGKEKQAKIRKMISRVKKGEEAKIIPSEILKKEKASMLADIEAQIDGYLEEKNKFYKRLGGSL